MEPAGKQRGPKQTTPSLELALNEAQQLLYAQDYEAAIAKYELALAMDPDNTKVMDTLAEVYLESIQKLPNEGASKYMLMGQMLSGPESLLAFNKGCEILRKDLKAKANRGAAKLTGVKQKLIAGLCAIAELFMTDLCEQEDAEQQCDKVLAEALKLDKNNYEALQLLASFRISQQNNPGAVEALRASYNLWKDLEPNDEKMPSYEFRVATSKLLLELQEWEWAQELLQSMLEEEDSVAEVWYLLSFAFVNGGSPHEAVETGEMARRLLEKQGITDPRIVGQVDAVLARATEEAKNVPPPTEDEEMADDAMAGDNDDNDDGDDDEEMDVDS